MVPWAVGSGLWVRHGQWAVGRLDIKSVVLEMSICFAEKKDIWRGKVYGKIIGGDLSRW